MARKFNPQTKQWEREVAGKWVPIEAESAPSLGGGTALDEAITEAFGEANGGADSADLQLPQAAFANGAAKSETVVDAPAQAPAVDNPVAPAGQPGDGGVDLVDEIPGLTSADGARGTRGTVGVRSRLQGLATRSRKGRKVGEMVQVGPRSAKASGPAVKDSTAARQQRAQLPRVPAGQVTPSGKAQRYTNRPAPGLLSNRPKWVQDLFEAHFRSDLTLGMRREYGRMKISRQDYAIGWLTLLDKIREDPSIARAREAKNGKD
jgi:hypothetical protein